MRTVVFSDKEIAKQANAHFVSAWINKKPDVPFADGLYDKTPLSELEGQPVGSGLTNLTSVFATADGRVLSAVPGYLDRVSFKSEMDFVIGLARKLKEAGASSDEAAAPILYDAHRDQSRVGAKRNPRGEYILETAAAEAHQWMARIGPVHLGKIGASYFDALGKGRYGPLT